jgi:hypothetical protein
MKRVSDRFFQLAVLGALTGMGLGVMMGKSGDHSLFPLHAHINLLIWVSMSIYALFYKAYPQAAASKLAPIHFGVNVIGVLTMLPLLGILLMSEGNAGKPVMGMTPAQVEPILGLTTMVVWASMLLFAVIVFRATMGKTQGAAEMRDAA